MPSGDAGPARQLTWHADDTVYTMDGDTAFETSRPATGATENWVNGDESSVGRQVLIELQRVDLTSPSGLMGAAARNPLTGRVYLHDMESWRDFFLIDLWRRHDLCGTPKQLGSDPYLFKPLVLNYRSWIYQGLIRQHEIAEEEDAANFLPPKQTGPSHWVRKALSEPCVDASVPAGRYCTAMVLLPMLPFGLLSGEWYFIISLLFLTFFTLALSNFMNNPAWYRFDRLFTLPIRLGFCLYSVSLLFSSNILGSGDFLKAIGLLLASGPLIYDLFSGDLSALICLPMNCTYEIVREIPGANIFLTRRVGDAGARGHNHFSDLYNRFIVDHERTELVSGFNRWSHDYVLIAEVQGLLVELLPLYEEDWQNLHEDMVAARKVRTLPFVGLDVFDTWFSDYETIAADLARRSQVELRAPRTITKADVLTLEDLGESDDESAWAKARGGSDGKTLATLQANMNLSQVYTAGR